MANIIGGSIGAGKAILNDYTLGVEDIDGGHRLTITRGSEVQTLDLMNGKDGADGKDGAPGADGRDGIDGKDGAPGAVQTVNGEAPDESGNVQVSGLPDGAEANMQLVTDADGVAKWEGKPFYDGSLISVPYQAAPGLVWYKVSDDVPTGDHSLGAPGCFVSNGLKTNSTIIISTDDVYAVSEAIVIVTLKDNVVISELDNIKFPEKGTYFLYGEGYPLITGFALGMEADPEITWDGNTGTIKTLDKMFIPPVDYLIMNSSTTDSTMRFKITIDDSGTISTTNISEGT